MLILTQDYKTLEKNVDENSTTTTTTTTYDDYDEEDFDGREAFACQMCIYDDNTIIENEIWE